MNFITPVVQTLIRTTMYSVQEEFKVNPVDNPELSAHYICTPQEAWELTKSKTQFWVSNCGCRESRGPCTRSRIDVCLMFKESIPASGSGKREVTLKEVEEIFCEAQSRHLVARPYRNKKRTATEGICFCCDDCCGFFLNLREKCNKGAYIQITDLNECTQCGACTVVCYFDARRMDDGLIINEDNCYGCGLCVDACPGGCIQMVPR